MFKLLLQLKISGTMTTSLPNPPPSSRLSLHCLHQIWLLIIQLICMHRVRVQDRVAVGESQAGQHICPVVISVGGQLGAA